MKVLVSKMENLGFLKVSLIFYCVLTVLLALVLPVTICVIDITLMANPVILGLIIGVIVVYGLPGYFYFAHPFVVYHKLPKVLAETDGEFVYFHGKKEAKISLNDLSYCYMDVDVPRIFHPGFLREFIIHKFSSDYGSITLNVPNHGTVKMQFVANAEEVGKELLNYINENSEDL
jgi:hypothetical protein